MDGCIVDTIISGGQSGVDRAALDAAIDAGLAHDGWCPRGRWAEDGPLPERYALRETASPRPAVRTRRNVKDSDATLIVLRGPLRGGTRLTHRLAGELGRPALIVDLRRPPAVEVVTAWLGAHSVRRLNVAGPRESQSPGIHAETKRWLDGLFGSIKKVKPV